MAGVDTGFDAAPRPLDAIRLRAVEVGMDLLKAAGR